jgi:hypothetical protein
LQESVPSRSSAFHVTCQESATVQLVIIKPYAVSTHYSTSSPRGLVASRADLDNSSAWPSLLKRFSARTGRDQPFAAAPG